MEGINVKSKRSTVLSGNDNSISGSESELQKAFHDHDMRAKFIFVAALLASVFILIDFVIDFIILVMHFSK